MNPVLLLLAFLAISGVHAQKTQTLDPFSSINVCGSFDIGIQPSKDNTYSAELIGDESQFSSMKASVSDGVLSIENPGSINTQKGVAMIISAPSDVLKSIKTSGVGNVYVVPGFTADNFSLTTGGTGNIKLAMDVKNKLTVDVGSNSVGNVTVAGSSGSLMLTSKGTGNTEIFGVSGPAKVDLNGVGDVYIGGGPDSAISGTSELMSPVQFTGKSCGLPDGFFGPGCEKVKAKSTPKISLPSPNGITMTGPSTCS